MSEQPDNLVLVYLRRIDEKLDRLSDEVRDVKMRATTLEESLAGVNRRLERVETRLDRIERRLDLVELPH